MSVPRPAHLPAILVALVLAMAVSGCAHIDPMPQHATQIPPGDLDAVARESRRLQLAHETPEALRLLEGALAQARQGGSPAGIAALLNERGLALSWSGQETNAVASFSEAIDVAGAAGERALAARAALNAADALRRRGDGSAARAAVANALSSLAFVPPSAEKSHLLAGVATRLEPAAQAQREALLREALAAAEAGGDLRARSQALGLLAELARERGRPDEALDLVRQALFAAQAAQAPDLLFRWEWLSARLAETRGDVTAAIAHYRRAHASLPAFRHDLLADLRLRRESYRDAIGPAFLGYANLLLRTAGRAGGDAARRDRLLEAREAIEQMKAVELEDYFQDECVARLQSRARRLESLAARTAVIYPVIFPDRLDLLVSAGEEIERVSVPVSGRVLEAEAHALRRLLEKRTTRQYLPHAQRLHAWLIEPVSAFLAAHAVETLVVIPDGALRGIPFAALHDGTGFLARRYALATAPALSLVESGAGGLAGRRALVGGLSEAVQDYPGLPQVARELDEVGGLFDTRLLGNAAFRVPAVREAMGETPFSVVHIASHGEFDSDPRRTFLLTWDGRMSMDVLERLMRSGRLREDPVELLTLSACRTAAGDDRAALGLAGVAVKAGARSALATLWYINDEASSRLVTGFYRAIATGKATKAQALREAQGLLLEDPRYRHPGYWAAFLLIGDWQ